MIEALPFSQPYNLNRLGHAGDTVSFVADADQRAAIAKWSEVLAVEAFEAKIDIRKISATRFGLVFHLKAEVAQACVVTLDPVAGKIDHRFERELHFIGGVRHKDLPDSVPGKAAEVVLDADPDEGPEEIQSLHYDLAAPVLEEYALSLDPYPRRPGAEFAPETAPEEPPASPFAVLKGLK